MPTTCVMTPDDVLGIDPLLGPLADNGGPTKTMALRAGSPAIGSALPDRATGQDQRGVERHDPDSGAFERKPR